MYILCIYIYQDYQNHLCCVQKINPRSLSLDFLECWDGFRSNFFALGKTSGNVCNGKSLKTSEVVRSRFLGDRTKWGISQWPWPCGPVVKMYCELTHSGMGNRGFFHLFFLFHGVAHQAIVTFSVLNPAGSTVCWREIGSPRGPRNFRAPDRWVTKGTLNPGHPRSVFVSTTNPQWSSTIRTWGTCRFSRVFLGVCWLLSNHWSAVVTSQRLEISWALTISNTRIMPRTSQKRTMIYDMWYMIWYVEYPKTSHNIRLALSKNQPLSVQRVPFHHWGEFIESVRCEAVPHTDMKHWIKRIPLDENGARRGSLGGVEVMKTPLATHDTTWHDMTWPYMTFTWPLHYITFHSITLHYIT
jgi:hypothetical protein